MDAFELLKADHKKVEELFDRLEAARGKAKLDVFKEIKSELELHTHIEETIFYPALEKPEETHDLTLEAYEEHKVVKKLLAELSRGKSADDEWQAKAKVLRENIEHHVKEEENELFDKADDALSTRQVEQLGARMEAEKSRKQGRVVPKPSAKRAATKSKKTTDDKRGILSKIAEFVGLGGDTAEKSPPRKAASKKKPAARRAAKASPARSRSASKKKTARGATASTRSSASQGAMRTSASRSTGASKKRASSNATKKAAKKKTTRK